MQDTNIKKLREQVVRLLNERDGKFNSLAKFALASGVSKSYLSHIKSGSDKMPGKDSEAWTKIENFIRSVGAPRRQKPLAGHIDLPITRIIQNGLDTARQFSDIALIYGAAGCGKSHAARHYASKHSGVRYMSVTPGSASTMFSFLRALARGIEVPIAATTYRLEELVLERLAPRGGAPTLLICDECHLLSQKILDELRCIYDNLEGRGFGLALLGNQPILSVIRQRTAAAQIISRIGIQINVATAGNENVAAILAAAGIDGKDRQMIDVARHIAGRDGGLRTLIKVVRDAIILSEHDKETLNAEHLQAAASDRVADSQRAAA